MRISLIHFHVSTLVSRDDSFHLRLLPRRDRCEVFFSRSFFFVLIDSFAMDKNKTIVVVGLILINSCSFALIVVLLML
jgi:hypothetical protein